MNPRWNHCIGRFLASGAALLLAACAGPATPLAEAPATSLPEYYTGPVEEPSPFVSPPIVMGHSPRPWKDLDLPPNIRVEALLEYVVDASGQLVAARVVETNHAEFAAALLRDLRQCRFIAGQKAGQPVAVRVQTPVFLEKSTQRVGPQGW